jgi:hypothetical protein
MVETDLPITPSATNRVRDKKADDTMEPRDASREVESDAIQRFFVRPFFQCLTIGIPFCIFKLLFGIVATRSEEPGSLLFLAGAGIIVWASFDLCMNTGRMILDLLKKPAGFEYCTIAQLGRFVHRPMAFLAFDTLLTFGIICAMLWSGGITRLTGPEPYFWYAATTLNLISLSLVSLYHEIRSEKHG